jgi:glycosyltransferase involved in cell wall biosynthesis
MNDPMVSVLMPVHNGAKHIQESIDSILAQSFMDFEIVIVDDGSTDNTPALIQTFTDSRIRVLRNEENLKIAVSLNRGLNACRGAFIARMDCDDLCNPRRLERQFAFLDTHPDVGICGTFQEYFGGYHDRKARTPINHEDIAASLLFSPTMLHSTVMFRASAVKQYNLFYDPAFHYCEDYELWVRAARHIRLANMPEYLSRYRWNEQKNWELDEPALMEGLRKIWTGQLSRLGMVPSEPELNLHAILGQRGKADKYALLHEARMYLRKLLELNSKAGSYKPEALLNQIRRVWRIVCYRVARNTPLAWPALASATVMPSVVWSS